MEDTKIVETIHTTATHTHGEPKERLASNTLTIVGFLVLIVIVLWGLFHIATLGAPWFSSLFGTSPSSMQVTAPANVTSGIPFAISWKYSTSEKGLYAFLYQCKDTVHFETSGADGLPNAVPCGAAYTVAPTNNTLMLVPQLSGSASTSLSVTIIFIPSATSSKQVQGNALVTVNPSTMPPVVITPPSTPTPIPQPTPRPTGPTDLSVQIISVEPDGAGGAIATFDIGNVGQSATGVYSFTAQLPTADGYLYNSPVQSSLAPGDHIVNTLRFSQAVSGIFSVVVDPAGTKNESNTNNNYASRQVSMPQYNYNSSYPQPYPYAY